MTWNGRTERSSADGAGEAGSSADAAQREEASGAGVDGRMGNCRKRKLHWPCDPEHRSPFFQCGVIGKEDRRGKEKAISLPVF